MKKIEVCLTPDLLHHYEIEDRIVVVADIFRATSTMVTAMANGVQSVIPVATIEECKALQEKGYLAAAERNTEQIEGCDFGNSPLSFVDNPEIKGKNLVMTTSNGTIAITKAKNAREVVIGAFLNQSTVVKYLRSQNADVLLLCAGWKGCVNLEDAMFMGALLNDLLEDFKFSNDACGMARSVFHLGKNNPKRFLTDSSHFQRLKGNELLEDIEFCLTMDKYDVLPVLKGEEIVVVA